MSNKAPHFAKGFSLLDRALSIPIRETRKNQITVEEMELAVAWVQDKVTLIQVQKAVGDKTASNTIARLGYWLREAYRHGMIVVKNG